MSEEVIECPECWVEMDKRKIEVFGPDVTIDICPDCGGIWLDDGELKKLVGDKEMDDYLTKEIGTKARSPLLCPSCGHLMDLEKAEDVVVDVCLNCHGMWLDPGELEALKDISEEGFEGDQGAKATERYEEMVHASKLSYLERFLRRLNNL